MNGSIDNAGWLYGCIAIYNHQSVYIVRQDKTTIDHSGL